MKKFQFQKGTLLILAVLVLGILLILGVYFLTFSLTESRISKSQKTATQTYYLAEAGINKAIWKLKNEEPWKTCFATSSAEYGCNCNNWQDSFQINLIPDSTTTVSIINSACAKGQVIATSTLMTPDKKIAQRVVKTTLFQALASPTQGAAMFSGGTSENIDISFSKIKIYGSLFSNHHLNIKWLSNVEVYSTVSGEGKVLVAGNFDQSWDSNVSSTAICAKNICQSTSTCGCIENDKFDECEAGGCPINPLSTPLADFDSSATTSFKTRAQTAQDQGLCQNLCNGGICMCDASPCAGGNKCVLSNDEFEDILWAAGEGGTLTLNATSNPQIVYVEGGIDLKGGRQLIVNGALVADGSINIGEYYKWTRGGEKHEGFSQITINRPTATTTSGLLAKAKINFGLYSSFGTTTITGVVYANDEIRITSLPQSFFITGGMVGRKLSFNSVLQWLHFILDDQVVLYGLGYIIDEMPITPVYSPVITVEHWEEEY